MQVFVAYFTDRLLAVAANVLVRSHRRRQTDKSLQPLCSMIRIFSVADHASVPFAEGYRESPSPMALTALACCPF
jgi:hypothetical protein